MSGTYCKYLRKDSSLLILPAIKRKKEASLLEGTDKFSTIKSTRHTCAAARGYVEYGGASAKSTECLPVHN